MKKIFLLIIILCYSCKNYVFGSNLWDVWAGDGVKK